MKAAHMKQKIVIPALVGMMMIPGSAVYAADQKEFMRQIRKRKYIRFCRLQESKQ